MPIAPNAIERLAAVRLSWAPGPLLDVLGGMGFWAIATAVRVGLFEALAAGPATARELSEKLDADERGIEILLHALEVLGYVKRNLLKYPELATLRQHLTPYVPELQ